jgi:uncharacterized protein (TIGR03382 family)
MASALFSEDCFSKGALMTGPQAIGFLSRGLMVTVLGLPSSGRADQVPVVEISSLRVLNAAGTGSIVESSVVAVQGVAITEGRRYAPTSTQCPNPPCEPGVGFYVDDASGGILIWSYVAPAEIEAVGLGTEVRVTGKVSTYRGRLQLTDYPDPACADALENTPACPNGSLTATAPALEIIAQDAPVPLPIPLDLSGFIAGGEQYEGRLLSLVGVFSADASQRLPGPGASRSFHLRDGSLTATDSPVPLYIEKTTDIGGNEWPGRSQCDLLAIGDQFAQGGGAAGASGRQLRARQFADFSAFRARDDDRMPTERTPLSGLRDSEGGESPQEGKIAWIEGWLNTSGRLFATNRTSGVGFTVQDDSGGVFVISDRIDKVFLAVPADADPVTCQRSQDCIVGQACSPLAVCQATTGLDALTEGKRVRVIARVQEANGRLRLADPNFDEQMMIEVMGDGGEGLPAERFVEPELLSVSEFLRRGELQEGVLTRVAGLHLAGADQKLPLSGRGGTFRVGDEDDLALDIGVQRHACELDAEGLDRCINRDDMSLPPAGYSGDLEWNAFAFDVIGVGDQATSGGGSGQRLLIPRRPSDIPETSFVAREGGSEGPDAGPGGGVAPPPGGCGCTGGVTLWPLLFVGMPALLRRRRR